MRESQLTDDLTAARDTLAPADQIAGRQAVERRVRTHQRRRIALVAVVVALVVGGAAVGLSRTESDQQGLVTTPPAEEELPPLPRIMPTSAPWELASVFDTPLSDADLLDKYGSLPVNRPTVEGLWTDGSVDQPDPESRIVAVVSQQLDAEELANAQTGGRETTSRVEPLTNTSIASSEGLIGDRWVSVVGRNLTEEEAAAVADQITEVNGVLDVAPPAGLDPVPSEATGADGWVDWTMDDGVGYSMRAEGYVIRFALRTGGPAASVVQQRVDDSFLWMKLLYPTGRIEISSYDGHPAFFEMQTSESCTTDPAQMGNTNASQVCTTQDDGETLYWWPSPGVMMAVQAPNRDQVLELASTLTEVDDAAWAAFASSATGELNPAPSADAPDGGVDMPATTAPPAGTGGNG